MKDFLDTALEAARAAGEIQMERLAGRHEVSLKGVANLVTEVDLLCEKEVISIISGRFPDHSFLAEEGGETRPGSDHLWIIDPLDGTTNYAHGFRRFCVSIALAIEGEVKTGVVYNPILDEIFTGIRGEGAWLEGEPLRVSAADAVKDALIGTGFAYDRGKRLSRDLDIYVKILPRAQSVRRSGSAALDLCDVACGRYDAFWELNLNAWDVAAGALFIEEAGGKWTGVDGEDIDVYSSEILATNGAIHGEMVEIIQGPISDAFRYKPGE